MHSVLLIAALQFGIQFEFGIPPLESRTIELPYTPFAAAVKMVSVSTPLTTRELVNAMFHQTLAEELTLDDYDEIDRLFEAGELVDVPNDPEKYGFLIRLNGRDPIAEKEPDPELKKKLLRLRPEALELLIQISVTFREECALQNVRWKPLEVTSLARTIVYQRKLCTTNANACTDKQRIRPTHTFALGLDIGRVPLSHEQQRILSAVINEYRYRGDLIHFFESHVQAAHHLLVPATRRQQLSAAFRERKLLEMLAAEFPQQ